MRKGFTRNSILGLPIFALGYGSGMLSMQLWRGEHTPVVTMASPLAISGASAPASAPRDNSRQTRQQVSRNRTTLHDPLPDFGNGTGNPALLQIPVEQFSDEELLDIIRTYTHLAPHDIPEDVTIDTFAGRLKEIYYGDSFDRVDNHLDALGLIGEMEFDLRTESDNRAAEPRDTFATDNRRIYASFETPGYEGKAVMVKWSRVDSPEVYLYDKYGITSNKEHNYVWLDRA